MRAALGLTLLTLLAACGETPATGTPASSSASGAPTSRPAPGDAPDPTLAKLLRRQGKCIWLSDGSFSECEAQQELSKYVRDHRNEAAFETCILSVDARQRTERALAGACLNTFTFEGTPEERAGWDARLFKILLPRLALEPNDGVPNDLGQGVRAIFAAALSELSAEHAGMTQAVIDAIRTMPRPDGKATERLLATLEPDSLEEKEPPAPVIDLAMELASHEDAGTRRSAYELLSTVKSRPEVCKVFSDRLGKDESWSDALSSYAATGERCASERPAVLGAIQKRLRAAADPKRSRDDELKDFSGLRRFVRLPLEAAEMDALVASLEALIGSKNVTDTEVKDAGTLLQELKAARARPAIKRKR